MEGQGKALGTNMGLNEHKACLYWQANTILGKCSKKSGMQTVENKQGKYSLSYLDGT